MNDAYHTNNREVPEHMGLDGSNCRMGGAHAGAVATSILAMLAGGWLSMIACANAASGAESTFSVVPLPVHAKWDEGAPFQIKPSTIIVCDGDAEQIAARATEALRRVTGYTLKSAAVGGAGSNIVFRLDQNLFADLPAWQRAECYRLKVDASCVELSSTTAHGFFNGVQTLAQLIAPAGEDKWQVRACEVEDYPRFQWRGLLLDPARHFLPPEFVKKFIEVMACYKFNSLQLHLTDDQGWRIEIKKYPRLTEIGSIRKESPRRGDRTQGDGQAYGPYFYTQDQIRELVAYAQARHVTLVPEIEIPGHFRAALAAHPEFSCTGGPFEVRTRWGIEPDILCAGNDSAVAFIQDVLGEVCALFPSEFIHIGGDEAPRERWQNCPKCQARMKAEGLNEEAQLQTWLNHRLEAFLASKGRRMIGWDEILEGGLTPGAVVMSWRGSQGGIDAAKADHDVIMSPTTHCYLDYAQAKGPSEPESIGGFIPLDKVYSFDPEPAELTASQRRHILGAQGNLWGEYFWDGRDVEYSAFPRALALAEVNWSPAAGRSFESFVNRLNSQYAQLDRLQVNYRRPDTDPVQDATEAKHALRLGPKPNADGIQRRPHPQPTVPDGVKELPFDETAPEPALTEPEKERGYLLFQRPLTESVYPNTRPFPDERLESLVAFATPGEFEPVTFALYPVRPLQNLRVRVSSLASPAGEIPADCIDVRLATYWNIGYPAYTTLSTYRRVPELLERVTVHSSPAGECQRYWLTVHVPDDAKPGLYRGTIAVWDDGFGQAVEIPLALRVLGFRLQKDPHKHFSAYFYARNKALYKGRDEAFIRQAADKDYQAMVDHGLDMLPTLYLGCEDGKRIVLVAADELERMLAAGLKGPVPVTADNVIARIYRDMTPGGKRENHWRISPLPPPAFYERVTELFRAFEVQRRAKGWPEFICCPIDEVDASCKEFGAKVYAAVKAAGLRTYATKDPIGADAADYASHLDIWCSQPYSVPYERIVTQNRYEYWCYPNHNAGEIKDRRTMCKGGRMTYGFGLWRSGYTTLIPWNWSWPTEPDPFDYLRGRFSGCGQRVDDDGEVIPAVYWSCFREGYDDGRYLYTLQQAIVEREGASDPACLVVVDEGRRLLQEIWDAIRVQPKYLADGMWPSEEFDALRWRLATQTERLLAYPAVEKTIAPSVLVAPSARPQPVTEVPSPYETADRAGNLETLDLGGTFDGWKNGTAEGKTEVTEAAGRAGKIGMRWTVEIDHQNDGGEGGTYPVGWPRLGRDFKPGELDLTRYDTLEFWIRIDSNRDEVSDDHTPVGLVISSHGKKTALYEKTVDLGGEQRSWVPLRFSVKQMMAAAQAGEEPWKSVSRVQLYVAEHDYAHGTRLAFDVGEVSLLRLTAPVIAGMDAPRHLLLPCKMLAFTFDVIGTGAVAKGSHVVVATLEGAGGEVHAEARQDLADPHRVALPLTAIKPATYTLRLTIRDAEGKNCSEAKQSLTIHAGPLAPRSSTPP